MPAPRNPHTRTGKIDLVGSVHLALSVDTVGRKQRADLLYGRARSLYDDALTEAIAEVGCSGPGHLSGGAELSALKKRAEWSAASIAKTYNKDLLAMVEAAEADWVEAHGSKKGMTRLWLAKTVRPAIQERDAWKETQIGVTEQTWVNDKARQDFFTRNGVDGRAKIEPGIAVCPICQEAVRDGWLPVAEAFRRWSPPWHPGCPHNIVVESAKESIPDCASLWRGQAKIGRKSESVEALIRALEINFYHKPSGPGGGQFTSAPGSVGVLAYAGHNAPALTQGEVAKSDHDKVEAVLSFTSPEMQDVLKTAGLTADAARKQIDDAREFAGSAKQTRDSHSSDGKYTKERQRLHDEIEQELLSGRETGVVQPSLFLTGGYPGSGKSYVLKQPQYAGYKEKHVTIDSDNIKERLALADGIKKIGKRAASYHAEADDIIASVFEKALSKKMNIGLDGTLKNSNKMVALVERFKARGYKVEVAYIDIPIHKAMGRAVERFLTGGRFVDPVYIASHDTKNIKTLGALKPLVNVWRHWDNDVPRGVAPRLIGEGVR